MKSDKIGTVKFLQPIEVGPSFTPHSYLNQGQLVGEHHVEIKFDDDPRFVLLTLTPRMTATINKKNFSQLIPLAVITTILMTKDDKSVQPEAKVGEKVK